jgi:hypothetical protein
MHLARSPQSAVEGLLYFTSSIANKGRAEMPSWILRRLLARSIERLTNEVDQTLPQERFLQN